MSLGLESFFESREIPLQRPSLHRIAYLLFMTLGCDNVLKIVAGDVQLEDGKTYLDIYFARAVVQLHSKLKEHKLSYSTAPLRDSKFYGTRLLWDDVRSNKSILATVEKLKADPNTAAFCLSWAEEGEELDYDDYIQAMLESFFFAKAGMGISEALIDQIFADSYYQPKKMIRARPQNNIANCKEYSYTHMEIDTYSEITFVLENRLGVELLISVNWNAIPWGIITGREPLPQTWQDNFSALRKKQIFVIPSDYQNILEAISGEIEYKKGVGLQLVIRDRSIVDKLSLSGIKSLTLLAPRESVVYGVEMQSYYYACKDIINIFAVCEGAIKKRVTREVLWHSPPSFFNLPNYQGDIPDSYKPCEKEVASLKP